MQNEVWLFEQETVIDYELYMSELVDSDIERHIDSSLVIKLAGTDLFCDDLLVNTQEELEDIGELTYIGVL